MTEIVILQSWPHFWHDGCIAIECISSLNYVPDAWEEASKGQFEVFDLNPLARIFLPPSLTRETWESNLSNTKPIILLRFQSKIQQGIRSSQAAASSKSWGHSKGQECFVSNKGAYSKPIRPTTCVLTTQIWHTWKSWFLWRTNKKSISSFSLWSLMSSRWRLQGCNFWASAYANNIWFHFRKIDGSPPCFCHIWALAKVVKFLVFMQQILKQTIKTLPHSHIWNHPRKMDKAHFTIFFFGKWREILVTTQG